MLAQIETHFRRDEPVLAHLLAHGTRRDLLLRPEAVTLRALKLALLTVGVGVSLLLLGIVLSAPALLVSGLAMAMVGPLPVWLLATAQAVPVRSRR